MYNSVIMYIKILKISEYFTFFKLLKILTP